MQSRTWENGDSPNEVGDVDINGSIRSSPIPTTLIVIPWIHTVECEVESIVETVAVVVSSNGL